MRRIFLESAHNKNKAPDTAFLSCIFSMVLWQRICAKTELKSCKKGTEIDEKNAKTAGERAKKVGKSDEKGQKRKKKVEDEWRIRAVLRHLPLIYVSD